MLLVAAWIALSAALCLLLAYGAAGTREDLVRSLESQWVVVCLVQCAVWLATLGCALFYVLPWYDELIRRRQRESRTIEQMKVVRSSLSTLTEEMQSIILKLQACANALAPVHPARRALESALADAEISLDKTRTEVLQIISGATSDE